MKLFIIITNRLIKLTGHLSKLLSYPFHFLFPKKRFKIPLISHPKIKSKQAAKVPRFIWQTNYTNNVSLPMYLNYLFNRLFSLNYKYHYVSTEARLEFISETFSDDITNAYKRLTDGASQADLWRLLVLFHHGGIYMDIDAHLVWPLAKIIPDDEQEVFLLTKHQSYTNYFIATKPNNPIIKEAIDIVVDNIEGDKIEGGVYEMTGPSALMRALEGKQFHHRSYRLTCLQGSFTNEYFQYIDKPRGKWIYAKNEDLLKK